MIGISLTFPAGRYHATPWGRHVNEGAVEWPPSPWRLLRALVATWKRTLPDLPQEEVEPILRTLARPLPDFHLPPASTGHTRHYMPWFKKGPEDRTLVFDTFVALSKTAPLIIRWPDASLDGNQRNTLDAILHNLNTLGRAESWCEASLVSETAPESTNDRIIAAPLNGVEPGPEREIVRLLCPCPDAAFADDHVVSVTTKTTGRGRNPQTIEERTTIYDPAWNICMETLQLHKERWSDPPGSRWVQYARPRECFKVKPPAQRRPSAIIKPTPQVVRYALDSAVLPLVTDTLPVAEAARRALMCLHGQLTKRAGLCVRSDVLSGKGEDGSPLEGHRHAYYLPTDEDGDGHLDHLTLVARAGFGPEEMRAIHRLAEIRPRGRDNASHPLRVLLLGFGSLDESQPAPFRPSCEWVSATPYLATRVPRDHGRHAEEDADFWRTRTDEELADARQAGRRLRRRVLADPGGWLGCNLREQLGHVLDLDTTGVSIEPITDAGAFKVAHRWRPIEFRRFRAKPGDAGGRRLAGAFGVRFPQPVGGPMALGHSAHFGMGLFLPGGDSAARGRPRAGGRV